MTNDKTPSLEFYSRYLHDVGGVEQEAGEAFEVALAAERNKADHYLQVSAELQQRIVDAPHGRSCPAAWYKKDSGFNGACGCWKAEL